MGVLLGSAVVPIALAITWRKANKWGCIGGAIAGLGCGIIAWLVTAGTRHDGRITVETTGGDYEMLAGNLAAIGVGGIVAVVVSYIVSHTSFSCLENDRSDLMTPRSGPRTLTGRQLAPSTSQLPSIPRLTRRPQKTVTARRKAKRLSPPKLYLSPTLSIAQKKTRNLILWL